MFATFLELENQLEYRLPFQPPRLPKLLFTQPLDLLALQDSQLQSQLKRVDPLAYPPESLLLLRPLFPQVGPLAVRPSHPRVAQHLGLPALRVPIPLSNLLIRRHSSLQVNPLVSQRMSRLLCRLEIRQSILHRSQRICPPRGRVKSQLLSPLLNLRTCHQ